MTTTTKPAMLLVSLLVCGGIFQQMTTSAFPVTPLMKSGIFASSLANKVKFVPSMFAPSEVKSTFQDPIMHYLEIKQAHLHKRREETLKEISKYEESLLELETKKAGRLAAAQLAAASPPVAGFSFTETAVRSAVKAFCWRIVAGSVTFCTTLKFSGSVSTALHVVGADFFSKAFTMFLGERLMNKSQAGRQKGSDDAGRSLAKALIWRLFAICNTLALAVFVSKDLSVASKIAGSDAVFKTALMFFYERAWARVQWGKEHAGSSALSMKKTVRTWNRSQRNQPRSSLAVSQGA